MRYIIVGLGNIGVKRRQALGVKYLGSVDPVNPHADWPGLDDVPSHTYDAAILSVPNQPKLELLQKLLALGKHVIVEKPLIFPDRETANTTRELAKSTGAVWYTSYPHRFEPLVVRLKELLHQNTVGPIYSARMVYGNGTVKNSIGTWRESGYGVLEDLGCHLIDMTEFLFDYNSSEYHAWEASRIESQVLDHCVFASNDRKIVLECGTTVWKNLFTMDIYGELGSLHLNGLRKWGPAELKIHSRVFPSGVPEQSVETSTGDDDSWARDIDEFEERVAAKNSSFDSDLRISMSLHGLAAKSDELSKALR